MRRAESDVESDFSESIKQARKAWGWYSALGAALLALAAYCVYAETLATVALIIVIGAVLILSSVVYFNESANRSKKRGLPPHETERFLDHR